MRILLVGSGGREHALATMIGLSPLCTKLFCAPGNAGIAEVAELVPVAQNDLDGLTAFCAKEKIDFVVVGPEDPLVLGLVDRLREAGIPAFGPSAKAAALEGSKSFTKELCAKYNIPTAAYRRFTETAPALAYLREKGAPIVIKADGLAAGKGVTVAMSLAEAEAAVRAALDDKAFGQAGAEIVIEEFLEGEEASFFAISDGDTVLPLIAAQDHKRAFDNDQGPNTGGMGAYSPAPIMPREMEYRVLDEIIRPTVKAMKAEGRPFKGVLFAGLMIGKEGPKLIEYNVRFGDPECQVLMLRLVSDLLPALIASAKGGLDKIALGWSDDVALLVVMATKGYPGPYGKGSVIKGVEKAGAVPGVKIFHAGTKRGEKGELLASGGRVLNICARARTVEEARTQAYKAIDLIDWPDGFCRRDIAWRALKR